MSAFRGGQRCCWDDDCPQHRQVREINDEDGYPVLEPERRTPGWFRRRVVIDLEEPKTGGRQ